MLVVFSASYAAALLFRLNDDKPHEFKKRLPPELAGNVFRCDQIPWNEVCISKLSVIQFSHCLAKNYSQLKGRVVHLQNSLTTH